MADRVTITRKVHERLAAETFNEVWTLIDRDERTADENRLMINTAHASLYHWKHGGEPLNFQRGEWMLARVYCIQNMPESALFHAKVCLSITEDHAIEDFDRSFAFEAMARASASAGDTKRCAEFRRKAEESASGISKAEDREYFMGELNGGDWFGVGA